MSDILIIIPIGKSNLSIRLRLCFLQVYHTGVIMVVDFNLQEQQTSKEALINWHFEMQSGV